MHIRSSKTIVGCILGPLALAQALINYKQAKDMGKREKQFSASGISAIQEEQAKIQPFLDENGNPRDISIPCPGNPSETCTLTRDGTTIISPDGSKMAISKLAAKAPTGPGVSFIMAKAYKEQGLLLAEMKKIDPNFDPLDPNNVVTVTTFPDGRRYTTMRSAPPPTLPISFEGKGLDGFASDSPVENQGSNNALYSQFAAGKASDSESQGRMSPQEEEENAAGLKNLYRKYFGSGGANPTTSFAGGSSSRSIPFGDSKIAPASENIFALAQDQYQTLRDRGEFIEGQQGSGNSGGGSSTGSQ